MTTRDEVHRFLAQDARNRFFYSAVTFATFEGVPGDFLEFGVYGGRSITLLAKYLHSDTYGTIPRRVIGFDSFEGLEEEREGHVRWEKGACAINLDPSHPILALDDPVTPDAVIALSTTLGIPPPELVVGRFADTMDKALSDVEAAALIHIDCDLYEATAEVLERVEPLVQPGTLFAFDDWFHYKGDPTKGEARAFREFLARNPQWGARPFKTYGVFCASFILYERKVRPQPGVLSRLFGRSGQNAQDNPFGLP